MDIAEIRTSLGLTQAAFAERLGVSPGHVGDLERRHRRVTIKIAAKLEEISGRSGLVDAVVAEQRNTPSQSAA